MAEQTPEFTIRPARPEDAQRCGDIAVLAWRPVYASFREMLGDALFCHRCAAWEDDKRTQVEWHVREHPELAIVTEAEGEIVGFLTYRLFPDKKEGEIGNNAVDPAYQGHGIGRRQCEYALRLFAEAGMVCATVFTGLDEAHAPARAMYEKAGFDKSTPHIRYYKRL